MDLIDVLKKQNTFMSVREIADATNKSIQTINRKVNSMTPFMLEKKVKEVKVGNRNSKCKVRFFKLKK